MAKSAKPNPPIVRDTVVREKMGRVIPPTPPPTQPKITTKNSGNNSSS